MRVVLTTSWALLLGMGLLMVGSGLQGTLLGVRATLEGFPTTVTGVLMSGYFVGFLVGSTLTPRLVARVGHIRVFAALASLASSAILVHAVFVEPATWVAMRLVSGICYAGLFVVAESWLNGLATNATRGRLLSVYMLVSTGGLALGQMLLNLADPTGAELFILISVLVSLGLIPMLLSAVQGPPVEARGRFGVRELYRVSPLGLVGVVGAVTAYGAFFAMGPVFAANAGLSVREISWFMTAALLGGAVLQWPLGRLSDRFDRRRVLTIATFVAAGAALAAAGLGGRSIPGLLGLTALLGGMMIPLYSLAVAHTNDFLERDQIVDASGTLVLMAGLGASLGPVGTALVMDLVGPRGFFWCLAGVHAGIGAFALWRMTRRAAKPLAEQGAYIAVAPRVTPTANVMYSEIASADSDQEAPAPTAEEQPATGA